MANWVEMGCARKGICPSFAGRTYGVELSISLNGPVLVEYF